METTEPKGNAKISKIITLLTTGFSLLLLILLTNMFFQQDEWHSFGLILGYGSRYLTLDKPLLTTLLFDRIGARVVTYGLFSLFGTQAIGFGILAWLLHVTNSFFVYLLTLKLLKNRLASLVASFFFLVNAVGHQGYSWFGTMAGTATSTALLLGSLIFFIEYLQKNRKKHFTLSLIFLLLSFFFKETAFFLFILYPVLWLIWNKKATATSFLKQNSVILVFGLFIGYLFVRTILAIPGERANYVSGNAAEVKTLVLRTLSYPIEGSIQVFLPAPVTFTLAQIATRLVKKDLLPDTSEYDAFYQTTMAEAVSLIVVGLFIFILFKVYANYIRRADPPMQRAFFLSLTFLPLSFLPYLVLGRFDAYLESRYYYASAVGAALLAGTLTAALIKTKRKRALLAILAVFTVAHALTTVGDLVSQVRTATVRKKILTTISTLAPRLNEKTVFYVTGNSPGYYGLPELKVPFQSGLGHILMVEYVGGKQLPPEFFQEETLGKALDVGFLYDIVGEGFRQVGNRGFGYYISQESLKEGINQEWFTQDDIIALFYDADTQMIRRTDLSAL